MAMLEYETMLGVRNSSMQLGLGSGSVQNQGSLSAALHCDCAVISVRDDKSDGAVMIILLH